MSPVCGDNMGITSEDIVAIPRYCSDGIRQVNLKWLLLVITIILQVAVKCSSARKSDFLDNTG